APWQQPVAQPAPVAPSAEPAPWQQPVAQPAPVAPSAEPAPWQQPVAQPAPVAPSAEAPAPQATHGYTAAQAADPATDLALLGQIAEHAPELRVYVAQNPSAYPGLLDWLGGLGDPQVDAALRARGHQG
ncbi:MAG: hypothetical protein ACTMIR_10755, partial [Cellulomonadaceae bacterium]